MTRFTIAARALAALVLLATSAAAQSPFAGGWVLDPAASTLNFTSVKKGSVVETSSFATLSGGIDDTGRAEVKVLLDSVDTKIDLRNVRMRFLFFETFKHPEATIALQLTEDMVADLPQVRRKVLTLPYRISLHGVSLDLSAEVTVTMLENSSVSVSSTKPISLSTTDFQLDEGRQKLEEAAGVNIMPAAVVTFDFIFTGDGASFVAASAPVQEAAPAEPASVALETQGNFSVEECAGRFEIMSRTGNIYFGTASARLTSDSSAVLDSIADIINRCPGMVVEIAGHTDSDGSDAANQRLSEARAESVASYFSNAGVPGERLVAVGYGESRPAFPNTSSENKRRNRRIEFALKQ